MLRPWPTAISLTPGAGRRADLSSVFLFPDPADEVSRRTKYANEYFVCAGK